MAVAADPPHFDLGRRRHIDIMVPHHRREELSQRSASRGGRQPSRSGDGAGHAEAAKAPPDGYTFLVTIMSSMVGNRVLRANLLTIR